MFRRSSKPSSPSRRNQITNIIESLEQRRLFAAAGDLDTSFSGDGRIDVADLAGGRAANDVEIVSGNKTLIAGHADGKMLVARYNADGTPDATFGNKPDGRVLVDGIVNAYAMEVRPDGKIVVAGWTSAYDDVNDYTYYVGKFVRLNSNGSLDTSFGGGDGIVDVGPTPFGYSTISDLKLQPDNKIVVSYSVFEDVTIGRFNEDGSVDTTFGNGDGVANQHIANSDFAHRLALAGDGSIFVSGSSDETHQNFYKAILVKFKPDGSGVDTAFGNGGALRGWDSPQLNGFDISSMVVAPGNKLLIGGDSNGGFGVARLDISTGAADTSFSGDGRVTMPTGRTGNQSSLVLQDDGRIVFSSSGQVPNVPSENARQAYDFYVYRLESDGDIDPTWNDNAGPTIVNFYNGMDAANAMAIQSDGKVVVAGYTEPPTANERFTNTALARFTASGKLDTTFSGDGKAGADFPGVHRDAASIVVQSDGKTLVGGTISQASAASPTGISEDFFLTRYNVNGTLDTAFGAGGTVIRDVFYGQFDVLSDVIVQPNGKILALGSTARFGREADVALVRFNADGSVDTSFGGGDGKVSVGLNGNDLGVEMGLRVDGKILVSATTDAAGKSFAVVRFNADGTLDKTYDSDGILYHNYGSQMAIQPDSKTLIANTEIKPNVSRAAVVTRLNSNGTLDTTYGTNGRTAQTYFENQSQGEVTDLAVQNGKTVVLTSVTVDGGRFEMDYRTVSALIRFNTNGVIDTSFGGGDGKEYYLPAVDKAEDETPAALAVDSQARLIIAGQSIPPFGSDDPELSNDVAVLRITPNGPIDSTFGNGGRVYTDFNRPNFSTGHSSERAADVAVRSDGRIVALGDFEGDISNSPDGYGVSRYLGTATTPPAQTPSISIADANTFEGNSGTKTLSVVVSLSNASSSAVTVKYRTKNQTAGDGDYGVVTTGTLTFAPGETSKTISIVIKGDTKVEGDETFRIELFENLNATLADGVSVCTIKNDD
jgi:uncharacterized delta-60 repeat protein